MSSGDDEPVGTLVTLDLPPDSPVAGLPWVITIGALGAPGGEEDWEPVVCGPYERGHALALAQAVVADEELMAVVEPLLPLFGAEAIRDEIALARATGEAPLTGAENAAEWETRHVRPGPVPTDAELRAGFARIAAQLQELTAAP